MSATLQTDLARIVGADGVLDAGTTAYGHDSAIVVGLRGRPDAVVLPGSAEEVAAVVRFCAAHDLAIVPRGGGTGYSGGATPVDGGVVCGLERMAAVRSFDPELWRINVDAGITTHTVQRLARENGLSFPVDPGAAEESQIGGNVATNAGGPHCFKYGVTRQWLLGLEVVLADGELARFGGPARKDVAGYDLTGLMCGSEGTLGVVTGVWLRLMPAPKVAIPVCGFYADAREGCEAIGALMASGVVPSAIEYLDGRTLELAGGGFPGGAPPGAGFLVVAEADGSEEEADELAEALGAGAVRPDARALWRWRDGVSVVASTAHGGKLSEDVAVPLEHLAAAIEQTLEIGARHGLPACSWGHAGDGNLHSTFLLDPRDAKSLDAAQAAAAELFDMAVGFGGTISGEHGLGVLKNGFLSKQWTPGAVAAHRAVKQALDPAGRMNPGKKLP